MESDLKKFLPKKKKSSTRKLMILDANSAEYKSISSFFNGTTINKKYRARRIYKINSETVFNEKTEEDDKVYCFHGSAPDNIESILEEGLKHSIEGCCGHDGVYLSAVSSLASTYGKFSSKRGEHCTCVLIVSFNKKNVIPILDKKLRNCDYIKRKRVHTVEKFSGDIKMDVGNLRNFNEENFCKRVAAKEIKETSCWTFTKYLASSKALNLEYLVFASL